MAASRPSALIIAASPPAAAAAVRCGAAAAKVRYSGETCRKHPTATSTLPPPSSHAPPPLFDVHGSSPSLFSFIYGDESAGCSHWCSQDLEKFCSEILTSNPLFHFWRLMHPPPSPSNTPPTFVLQQLLYSLPHRCLGWKMGPLFAVLFLAL